MVRDRGRPNLSSITSTCSVPLESGYYLYQIVRFTGDIEGRLGFGCLHGIPLWFAFHRKFQSLAKPPRIQLCCLNWNRDGCTEYVDTNEPR